MRKPAADVPPDLKAKAKQAREALKGRPPIEQLLTPAELADATPYYFALRAFVAELKAARQQAELTLADIAGRTGLAVETLSRLETGALVNPTWQTLARYAAALGRCVRLTLEGPTDAPVA
jgi:DNA-binding XRE family transcriptional regulator